MKINNIYILTILILAIFTSCNNSDNKSTEGSNSKSSGLFGKSDKKEEANALIEFNNKIVKAENSQISLIRSFTNNFDRFEQFVLNKVSKPNETIIAPILVTPPIINNLNGIVYPNGLSKEFQPLLEQMSSSIESLKTIQKEMDNYKSAEDWVEDKGAKLAEFKERATNEITKNRDAANQVFEKLKPIVDKAEEVTLEGNPLKSQYIRSKKLLDLVQKTNILAFETEDQSQLKNNFKNEYQQIEKTLNDNQKDDLPKEYQNKIKSFTSYNDAVNDFLGKMRIVQRELDAGTPLTENSLTALDNASKQVLSSYNSFVN